MITNIATNPSFEGSLLGGGVNGGTVTKQTSSAITGANGLCVSCPANSITDCGINIGGGGLTTITSGKVYTYSVSIRAITAGNYNMYVTGNSGGGSATRTGTTLAANQVAVLSITQAASGTGAATWYVLRGNGTVTMDFDVDGMIVTEGSTQYNFADGSSANWIWNGTPNGSTSTGPPV